MTRLRFEYRSETLQLATSITVLLPEEMAGQHGGKVDVSGFPVLYLLHGLSDDDTTWSRRTSIERYASDRGFVVVMPSVGRSFYTDQAMGSAYWTFLSEEVPVMLGRYCRVGADPSRTFVAGQSMGGYGALKLALRHPERFRAAASLSGALNIVGKGTESRYPEWAATFGSVQRARSNGDDIIRLLPAAVDTPPLHLWCGTEDFLLPDNRLFEAQAREAGIDITYRESAGGHEWSDWDNQIQSVMDWFARLSGTKR